MMGSGDIASQPNASIATADRALRASVCKLGQDAAVSRRRVFVTLVRFDRPLKKVAGRARGSATGRGATRGGVARDDLGGEAVTL
jgi:hypothetical protein